MKLGSRRDLQLILKLAVPSVIVLYIYGAYAIKPLAREAARLGREVRTARDRLRGLEAVTANETTLQEQQRQVNERVESLRSLLPPEEEVPAVIELISSLANDADVKIQTIFPERDLGDRGLTKLVDAGKKDPDAAVVYKEVPIQVEALAGFHQLGTFLGMVESGEKPLRVSSLRVSANPREAKRHLVRLRLLAYFAAGG